MFHRYGQLWRMFVGPLFVAVAVSCAWGQALPEKAVVREGSGARLADKFDQGRKWAILIGVEEYLDPDIPDLTYCVDDVNLVARILVEKCGYDGQRLLVMTDDSPKKFNQPLNLNLRRQIVERLKLTAAGDTVLVFFSGHGFVDKTGQGFLAPADCEQANLGLTGFRTDDLRDALQQCAATQKVLILDCCHAGSRKDLAATGPSAEKLAASFARARGLVTLASCAEEEKSLEFAAKKQGLFTWYLAEGMSGKADYDRDGIVNLDELYRFTVDQVPLAAQEAFGATQTPKRIIGADASGVIALARVERPLELPPPAPMPVAPMPVVKPPVDAATALLRPDLLKPKPPAGTSPSSTKPKPSLGTGDTFEGTSSGQEWSGTSLKMKLIWVQRGWYQIGSPVDEFQRGHDEDTKRVLVSRGYWIGKHEVTQAEYKAVMAENPSCFASTGRGAEVVRKFDTSLFPVESVTWEDAVDFCRKLTEQERTAGKLPGHWEFRLPSEAEWERACRAGTASATAYLEGISSKHHANFNGSADDAPFLKRTTKVAEYRANSWGLHDTYGNVWEWCDDWYAPRDSNFMAEDPHGPLTGEYRVLRGGGWNDLAGNCRSAKRRNASPEFRASDIGFRVVAVSTK